MVIPIEMPVRYRFLQAEDRAELVRWMVWTGVFRGFRRPALLLPRDPRESSRRRED